MSGRRFHHQKVYNTLLHTVFWFSSYYILLKIFTGRSAVHEIDYIYTGVFLSAIIPFVYFNLRWAIPRLLHANKYLLYTLVVILILVFAAFFNHGLFNYGIDFLLPGYYFISEFTIPELILIIAAFLLITTLFKLSKEWFQLNDNERQLAQIKEKNIAAELDALRSQINPHFLFNSLNNIYALSISKDKNTGEYILKLAESIRYILYDTNCEKVKLQDEIKLIRNLIDLHKLRVEKSSSVIFEFPGEVGSKEISPLLFLPLVENCFKHGAQHPNGFIHILLNIDKDRYTFQVKNSVSLKNAKENESSSGIGLGNLRKRLSLLYPQRHNLKVIEDHGTFEIIMIIHEKIDEYSDY